MSSIVFRSRQELIEELEARRSWAQARDKPIVDAHRIAEKEALTKYRAQCRELARLPYEELARRYRNGGATAPSFRPPSCPVLAETKLDRELRSLGYTRQERFTIEADGRWREVHWLLTHDDDEVRAC